MGKQTKPYGGILATPMTWRMDALWRTPEWARGSTAEWERRVKGAWLADARVFFDCCIALYRHFRIDPNEPGADLRLALALAGSPPVPAFTAPPRRGAPPKLGPIDTIRLVVACDTYERRSYAKTGSRPARREIARGVAKQLWAEALGLSDDTIRDLLPELARAGDAYRVGKPTAFQEQFYTVVVPLVFGSFAGATTPVDEAE